MRNKVSRPCYNNSSIYSHCNSISLSYSTRTTYLHSVQPTRTSICHSITSTTSYVLISAHTSSCHIVISTALSYSSLPIRAAATSPPAQLRTYSSLPIQQGHRATQLSTPENLEHAVITLSPEQLPCSTTFSSQQPPFTAPALPAADSNCLLQQTFITNQVLLTVLIKGPNYNADDTNGNGIEQYLGGGWWGWGNSRGQLDACRGVVNSSSI